MTIRGYREVTLSIIYIYKFFWECSKTVRGRDSLKNKDNMEILPNIWKTWTRCWEKGSLHISSIQTARNVKSSPSKSQDDRMAVYKYKHMYILCVYVCVLRLRSMSRNVFGTINHIDLQRSRKLKIFAVAFVQMTTQVNLKKCWQFLIVYERNFKVRKECRIFFLMLY